MWTILRTDSLIHSCICLTKPVLVGFTSWMSPECIHSSLTHWYPYSSYSCHPFQVNRSERSPHSNSLYTGQAIKNVNLENWMAYSCFWRSNFLGGLQRHTYVGSSSLQPLGIQPSHSFSVLHSLKPFSSSTCTLSLAPGPLHMFLFVCNFLLSLLTLPPKFCWVGKTPWKGNGSSCFCLGNLMDRGAWWATVYGVAKELDTTLASKQQQCPFTKLSVQIVLLSWPITTSILQLYKIPLFHPFMQHLLQLSVL